MKMKFITIIVLLIAVGLLGACAPQSQPAPVSPAVGQGPDLQVLVVETFLADIAQNVAGERLQVSALIPANIDPHAFEPTPRDVARIADSQVVIVNGAGLEEWLDDVLANAGGQRQVIEAAAGLQGRTAREGEEAMLSETDHPEDEHHDEGDPHFWLDPVSVIQYVENIRVGLSAADPGGSEIYAQNAAAYTAQLKELDAWIVEQVAQIPAERRLLVTNHESFGYFADRYGFEIIGTLLPSVSTGASPSAQQLARLVDHINSSGAPAIFLETGTNPQLAEQVAREAGVKVVTGLQTHSSSSAEGQSSAYIAMMKYNVTAIVEALK